MASRFCSSAMIDSLPSLPLPLAREILTFIALIALAASFGMAHGHRADALEGAGCRQPRTSARPSLMASRSCSSAMNDSLRCSHLPLARVILELIALIALVACFGMAHEHRADALEGARCREPRTNARPEQNTPEPNTQ